MNHFSSLDDALACINHGFAFGCRLFTSHCHQDLPGQTVVWITCGLPGVGKSAFAKRIFEAYPPLTCRLISRDVVRTDLIWEDRKGDSSTSSKAKQNLDQRVSDAVLANIQRALEEQPAALIIDGCHVEYYCLLHLVQFLHTYGDKVLTNLIIMGDERSWSNHTLSDKEEGDYSDFGPQGKHTALPLKVFEKKQKQFFELLRTSKFQEIKHYLDYCFVVPAYRGDLTDPHLALREDAPSCPLSE